jgi:hypothetical protein
MAFSPLEHCFFISLAARLSFRRFYPHNTQQKTRNKTKHNKTKRTKQTHTILTPSFSPPLHHPHNQTQ